MINYLEKTGKTDDEAIAAALEEIGLDRDDVSVEIIERAKPGFLGIGSVPARVRVSWESEDKEPEAAAPAAAAPEKAAEVPAAQTETAAPAKQSEPVQAPAAPADEPEDYQRVRSFLTGLLEHMGLEAEISITEREGGGLLVDLQGPGMGAVIGRRGETLDAIQHLTNYAVNHGSEKHLRISVDAENYRAKREESLSHSYRPAELRGRDHSFYRHRTQPPRGRQLCPFRTACLAQAAEPRVGLSIRQLACYQTDRRKKHVFRQSERSPCQAVRAGPRKHHS